MKRSELSITDANIGFPGNAKKRGRQLLPILVVFLTAIVGALVIVAGVMLLAFGLD